MRGLSLKRPAPFGGYSGKTLAFYGILTFLTFVVIMMVAAAGSRTKPAVDQFSLSADVILDAGHGGLDGGAISADGICEAPVTLAICRKTQAFMGLMGVNALLTREGEASLDYDPASSVRENKNADLKARLALAERYPKTPFLSIHLNQFPKAQYHGAQVFYSENAPEGKLLAEALQDSLRNVLDPSNKRVCKPSPEGIFLMKNLRSPAVTVECGFLSNPDECLLLQQEEYQTKLALAIAGGYFAYCRG